MGDSLRIAFCGMIFAAAINVVTGNAWVYLHLPAGHHSVKRREIGADFHVFGIAVLACIAERLSVGARRNTITHGFPQVSYTA